MLLDLRETVRNSKPIKYTLITVICIPFVLFGVGSYFSGAGVGFAAKVDGVEISAQEFDQAYSQQRRRLAQMFGGQIPQGFGDESALRQQALDGLLSQQVLRNTIEDHDFAVSDKTLAGAIQEIPAFQNEGAFDKERYMLALRSSGMSVEGFENSFRQDTAMAQLRSGLIDSSFVLPAEQERLESLTNQLRIVDQLTFEIDPIKEAAEVSDEELNTYFSDNAGNYQFPERVKIQYIQLNLETLAENVDVSDDDAQNYFTDNKGNYLIPEERKASHILLLADEDASEDDVSSKTEQLLELKTRIEAGEDFAALASEFSEDVGTSSAGGSLGAIAPGAMVPAFEASVFSLEEGTLSEPVRTEFGLHLIQLDEIVPEKGETFDQAKDKVIASIKRETAQREYLDLSELLTEQAFDNPDSLDAAADVTGLEIIESDWIDGTADTAPELSNPAILSAALAPDVLNEENNSEPVELGQDNIMVLRTLEHEDPRPKTLEDVREELIDTIKTGKAGDLLDAAVSKVEEALQADAALDLDALATENNAVLEAAQELSRQSSVPDRAVVADLFKLAKPTAEKPILHNASLNNGDRVLMVFRDVMTPEAAVAEGEEKTFVAANPRLGNAEFNVMLEVLRSGAEIETNDQLLNYDSAAGPYGQ